jgi:cyanophycin synthetase
MAIILDADPVDVPARYRDPERARRLVSVLADAVARDGVVIVPAREWEVQDYAREAGARVAIFAADGEVTRKDRKVACAVATAESGRIVIERGGEAHDAGALHPDTPPAAQIAAALAVEMAARSE